MFDINDMAISALEPIMSTPLQRAQKDGYINITGVESKRKIEYITSEKHVENYRLSAADEVTTDFSLPFCLLLFRNPSENDQFTRAIFHNINAKQIPLKLEENLKVILESPQVFSDDTLVQDPSFGWKYYLARKTLQNLDFTYFPAINS